LNKDTTKSKQRLKNLTRLLTSLILPYKKWLLIILAAMLLETIMGLATPWPLKIIIDYAIGGKHLPDWLSWLNTIFSENQPMSIAIACAIAMVLFSLIGGLAGYIDNYFTESIAQYIANDLRKKIFHHLQQLSLAYYDTHKVGRLLSTITTDVNTIQDFVSSILLSILVDALTIVGIFGLMLYLNWDFALVAVGVAPFLLLFGIRFKRAVKKATHEVRNDQAEMVTVLQHGLESIRAINAFGRQKMEEDRLEKISMETVHAALRARKIKSLISPFFTLVVSLCTAFVLWRGTNLVIADVMTIGSLTVFLAYLNKFFNPVKDLAKITVNIAQATVALERIQQILEADLIIPQKTNAIMPGKLKGDIVFNSVHFAYKPGNPVIKNINITISKGQHIGICGPTGSGKSTIACLIPRLYDLTAGSIFIDGVNITDYNLKELRSEIGIVMQDPMLFYGSVRDNIVYGRPDATEADITKAAMLANAHHFITKMPMGYNTIIGERGITLSGGERQRIGIARAVIRNAPILILDEPTASLDAESEKTVNEALERLMKGKTVITISHRLNILQRSDNIFMIKDGMVVEEGTHSYLLANSKYYAALYYINESALINTAKH